MISSSSRGAVAPRISVRPVLTMSAARVSSARPNRAGLAGEPLGLVLGDLDDAARGRVGHGGDDDQVAQPVEQVLGEAARVLAGLDDLLDDAEHGGAVVGGERVDGLVEQAVGGVAEQGGGQLVGDAVGSGRRRSAGRGRYRLSRTEPAPARTMSGTTVGSIVDALARAEGEQVVAHAPWARPAGTGSGGCATGWCR